MIKSLLLPRSKYEEAFKTYGERPFLYELKIGNQLLCYFGANHSLDPANHQYPKLREFWRKFLSATEGQERIVLVEGELRKVRETEEKAIASGAESSLITFLAHQANILVECADITKEEYLKDKSEEERKVSLLHSFVAYTDALRKHSDKSINFEVKLEQWCEGQRKRKVWDQIEISPSIMKELFKKVVGKDFVPTDNNNSLINPNIDGPITKFTRKFSDEREVRVVSEIVRHWESGKSVFVVFGSGHLVIQRPALEKLLK